MHGNYLDGYAKDLCGHCGIKRTAEGHDGCIGTLKNVKNACCGHGEERVAYIQFNHPDYNKYPNKHRITGKKAIEYINNNKSMDEIQRKALDAETINKISLGTNYSVMLNLMNLLRVREEIAVDPINDIETKKLAIKIQEDQIRRLLNFLT